MIDRARGSAVNLRTRFESIIKLAGLAPWPKLFQNLRASRETELMAIFPAKDVASWLGNSVPVAMAHYAMATAESFQKATGLPPVSSGGSIGGSISSSNPVINEDSENEKTPEIIVNSEGLDTRVYSTISESVGGTELESVTSTMSTLRSNQLS